MNSTNLIGRLTADPELKYTNSGKPLANFSLAIDTGFGDKEHTSFFSCVAWSKTGEAIHTYFKKGQRIAVQGELRQERWEDSNGQKKSTVKIHVMRFDFIEPKSKTENVGGIPTESVDPEEIVDNPFSDSDIPF